MHLRRGPGQREGPTSWLNIRRRTVSTPSGSTRPIQWLDRSCEAPVGSNSPGPEALPPRGPAAGTCGAYDLPQTAAYWLALDCTMGNELVDGTLFLVRSHSGAAYFAGGCVFVTPAADRAMVSTKA